MAIIWNLWTSAKRMIAMSIGIKNIAWLAGLLEGEGTFRMWRNAGSAYKGSISLALQMSDRDIVARAAELLGVKIWGPHGPYGQSKLQTWQCAAMGSKAAGWMMTLYPLMGSRRKLKFNELLNIWKSQRVVIDGRMANCHPDRKHSHHGMCKPCARKHRYITTGC